MRQAEILGHVLQGPLLPSALLALAERAAPPSNSGPMRAAGQVDTRAKGGSDVPAERRQDLRASDQGAAHHAGLAGAPAPAPHRLAHLCIEQLGQGPPAGLGQWASGLAAVRRPPGPLGGPQGGQRRPAPVGHKERRTVGRHDLRAVVAHTLGHRAGTLADVKGKEPVALGGHGAPDPLRRTLQARAGVGRADLPGLDRAEPGTQRLALDWADPYAMQDVLREGAQRLHRLHEPLQARMRVHLAPPRRAPEAEAFGQARANVHDEVDSGARAVQARAAGLEQVATTDPTPELPPGTTSGMASGAEIAPADPAPIGPVGVRAAVPRGGTLAAAPPRGHEARGRRGGGVRVGGGGVLTGVAARRGGEARKGGGSCVRLGRGPGGSGVVGHTGAGALGHTQCSMTHSHTSATSTN